MAVETWIVELLVAANVAVLSAFGAVMWKAYDIVTDLQVVLYGRNPHDEGFVGQTREAHESLAEDQRSMRGQLRLQGRLLNQLTYAITDLAEAMEDEVDADVDTERIEHVRKRVDESKWDEDDD